MRENLENDSICDSCPYCEDSLSGQWCEKVGGPTLWYGFCDEAIGSVTSTNIDENDIIVNDNKRAERRRRNEVYKKHLERLSKDGRCYPSPAWPRDEYNRNIWNSEEAPVWYKRGYRGQLSKYLKKLSNKKVRKYDGDIRNNKYRRIFDFWWSLI